MTPYCQMSNAELNLNQSQMIARKYATRDEIDVAFYGSSGLRSGRDERMEEFAKSYAERRKHERFHRISYRNQLALTFSGLSLLTIIYYIAVALYYWRQLRS